MIATGTGPFVAECISYLVVPLVMLVLGYPVIRKYRIHLVDILAWKRTGCSSVLRVLIVSAAICTTIFGWTIALSAFELVRHNSGVIRALPRYSFSAASVSEMTLGLFVISVVVPITEEVINRGIILNLLLRNGRLLALIFSATLFAVFHRPESIFSTFVIGLLLGMLYLRTNNLWMPIFVHAIYNAWTVVDRLLLEGTWIGMGGDPRVSVVGLCGLGVFVVGFGLSYHLTRPRKVSGAQCAPC